MCTLTATVDGKRHWLPGTEQYTEEDSRFALWKRYLKQHQLIERGCQVGKGMVETPGFAHAMKLLVVAE